MQNTSALYNAILADANHWFETTVGIQTADNSILYVGENQLFSVSTDSRILEGTPTIGKAISCEIDIEMLKPNATIPKMAAIIPMVCVCHQIGSGLSASVSNNILFMAYAVEQGFVCHVDAYAAYDGDYLEFLTAPGTKESSEALQQGVYFIDTREFSDNNGVDRLIIHGYDAMLKAEADYPSTNHAWPYLDKLVVAEIAAAMGVTVDSRVNGYLTAGYMIDLPAGYTMRETLEHIATAYAGSFVMSPTGELMFVPVYGLDPDISGNYLAVGNDALVLGNEGWCILV